VASVASLHFPNPARVARPKLRVGVFADSTQQPRWLVEALAKVAASDFAELALVSIQNRGQTAVSRGAEHMFRHTGNRGLSPVLRAYAKLDRKMFGAGPDWSEKRDIGMLVPKGRRMEWSRARNEEIDVAFALGDVDDGALEGVARWGVWRYCFGEEQGTWEPLAGVREVMRGDPVMASGLRIHRGPEHGDRLAYQSWARTFPFSLARSRDGLFPKTAEFLVRALRDLHAGGAAWFEQSTEPARTIAGDSGSTASLGDLARVATRVAQRTVEKYLTVGQWMVAYRFGGDPLPGPLPSDSCPKGDPGEREKSEAQGERENFLEGFTRLQPPKDRFWADPFPHEKDGRHYIFFEELPFAAGRAHISVIEVNAAGPVGEPVRVLERDYHLSYPFLVEEDGQLYMVPETANNHTVEIYRCVEFPHRWTLEKVLLRNVWAADATLHRADGRWWMFLAMGSDGGEVNDELHLFSSSHLLGEWRPHRRNPVKSDVRRTRPAGKLFTQDGVLYRPAQICAPLYGSGMAIHRVVRLDEQEYVEEEVRRIEPAGAGGILGIHTLNRAGALTVTDAFVRRSRF
jgi:hypothetical protein